MEYILILIAITGYREAPTSQAILFPTQTACEAAKSATKQEFLGRPITTFRAVCVPRNSP